MFYILEDISKKVNLSIRYLYIFFYKISPTFGPDFGMTGEFKQELRDGFIEACLHLVNRDFDALATDFVTLGYLTLFLFHF
jgi:predicted unusual protein kinase regulating ubiquinone biosynthesis (AarF/ABC1/UbiB family)